MVQQKYSDEFRRQAVDLYESTPGATVRGIAEELGVDPGTLRGWRRLFGTGKVTAADGTLSSGPGRTRGACAAGVEPGQSETLEQQVTRLSAENTALRAEKVKLTTEREILRSAAKYFAGETNW